MAISIRLKHYYSVASGICSSPIKAEGGFGKYAATASGIGEKAYTGVIRVKDPATDKYKFYPFEGKNIRLPQKRWLYLLPK